MTMEALERVSLSDRAHHKAVRDVGRPAAARRHRPRHIDTAVDHHGRRTNRRLGHKNGRARDVDPQKSQCGGDDRYSYHHNTDLAEVCNRLIRISDGTIVEDTCREEASS
jgi:hypothetical protein